MNLVPSQEDVISLLRETGALKSGYFEYPNGLHASTYLNLPLALRYSQNVRTLCVGLSRKLRANSEIRAMLSDLSIVATAPNGLPVAYGLCEALRAHQVYWAAREDESQPLRFPQYLEVHPGEKVLIVDDILRTGRKLNELRRMVENAGAEVVGIAVLVYQPAPDTPDFGSLPLFYLAKLDAMYYKDAESAERAYPGSKAEKVWS